MVSFIAVMMGMRHGEDFGCVVTFSILLHFLHGIAGTRHWGRLFRRKKRERVID